MKTNFLTVLFTTLLSTGLLAQQATNPPAAAPIATPEAAPALTNAASSAAATTNAPAAKSAKKKAGKKKSSGTTAAMKSSAPELKTVPLVAGPALVIASNVNVRGQAGLKGEVLGRVNKGQPVTVLSEVTLKKSGPDEPSAWAKILLPNNIHVWVNAGHIEVTNKTVSARKLNVRGGPGENYSVLGLLKRGDTIKELNNKGDWLEIEPPSDAFAFVAAQYLKQEPPGTTPAAPTEPAPAPTTVAEAAPVTTAPTEAPAAAPAATEAPAVTNAPVPEATASAAAPEEPPPKRIVQREGIVRGTVSIQAPTRFELVSPDNGRPIDYLYTTSHDLDLSRYKGMRIIVTGEEALDERWQNTPVITIQRIQVLE